MSTATFLGYDSVTRGLWYNGVGVKRGRSGYHFGYRPVTTVETIALQPSWVSLVTRSNNAMTGSVSESALEIPDGRTPVAGVFFVNGPLSWTVNVTDSAPHLVSTYVNTGTPTRRQKATVLDLSSTVLSVAQVDFDYHSGYWLSWVVAGSFKLLFESIPSSADGYALSSGLWFDEPRSGVGGVRGGFGGNSAY